MKLPAYANHENSKPQNTNLNQKFKIQNSLE